MIGVEKVEQTKRYLGNKQEMSTQWNTIYRENQGWKQRMNFSQQAKVQIFLQMRNFKLANEVIGYEAGLKTHCISLKKSTIMLCLSGKLQDKTGYVHVIMQSV